MPLKNLILVCIGFAVMSLLLTGISGAAIDPGTIEAVWLFDDGAGGIVKDSSGNNRHGDIQGGAKWTNDGKYGGALELDGGDDEVVITGYKGIGGNDPRTTLIWYRTTQPGDHRLVCWGANVNTNKYHTRLHDANTLRVETQGGQLFANEPDLADGEWHHLAIVLPPGSTMCHDHLLYVDGVQITNTGGNDIGLDTDITTHDVEIGYDQWIGHGNPANGTIDEVAIISDDLSENDIINIMNNGLANSLLAVEPAGKLAITWGGVKVEY
ncbi:LamG-like jellyroll fold domain-containing protein [Candidatus Poribacteria bacterium]